MNIDLETLKRIAKESKLSASELSGLFDLAKSMGGKNYDEFDQEVSQKFTNYTIIFHSLVFDEVDKTFWIFSANNKWWGTNPN